MYQVDGYWKVQLACLVVLVVLFVAMHFGWFVANEEMCYTDMRVVETITDVSCR